MADNKTLIDRLHDHMPKIYSTRSNPNWKAIVEAIGQGDQNLSELIQEVRQQFFISTASRPYLDRLAANLKVSRPKFVGMDDPTFREYIPILAYQPKQVKIVLDKLLDVFFFKDATTAFIQSQSAAPFSLKDGWKLEYKVDGIYDELINFTANDFADISNTTVDEVIGVINKQAQHSFAIKFDDRVNKKTFIRLFTNTIGSKGSIELVGGRSNCAFRFQGFNDIAGSGNNTVWDITKVGDTMRFTHTSGQSPNLSQIKIGDVAVIDIPGNEGSFVVDSVDAGTGVFTFKNLFGTTMTHDHSVFPDTKVAFFTPEKIVVFNNDTRAVIWEVSPGEIIVEMPASPPVVRRSLIGSAHINGLVSSITNKDSDTTLTLDDASDWPETGGQFVIQPVEEIQTHIVTPSEDFTFSRQFNTRFDIYNKYAYTSRVGNQLLGITPDLPIVSKLYEPAIISGSRDNNNLATVITAIPHEFKVDDVFTVSDTVNTVDIDPTINLTVSLDGTFIVKEVISPTSFSYISTGDEGASTGGVARLEKLGMANSGSLAYLTTARIDTGIYGPYLWDQKAPFVLSSLTAKSQDEIKAGSIVKTLTISTPNNIPNVEGFMIFSYGTENQEGPVRYLYKPSEDVLQLDPAYVFKNNHEIGAGLTIIRRRGAHIMSGLGTEYAGYITDPGVARETLQELMREVKSVGVFLKFLIRYPNQLFSALDVYRSCDSELYPVSQEDAAQCNL